MAAPAMDGIANFLNKSLLILRPTRKNLKILLRKCTTATVGTASSAGRKINITGSSTVPKPNPEKKVSREAENAVSAIQTNSNIAQKYTFAIAKNEDVT